MKTTPCNILISTRENKMIAPLRPSRELFRRLCLWSAIACASLTALTCTAANRTWTGTSGIDLNWMTPGNWQGGVAPSPGDNLIFQGVVFGGNLTNHNNYPDGTVFGDINIGTAKEQDYAVGGNRVVLTSGLSGGSSVFGAGGAYVFFNITLSNSQAFAANGTGSLILNDTIDVYGNILSIANSGSVVINGTLLNGSGSGSALLKTNSGTLTISSSAMIPPDEALYVEVAGGTLAVEGMCTNTTFYVDQGSLIVDGAINSLLLLGSGVSISGTGNFSIIDNLFNGQDAGGGGTFIPGDNGGPGIMQCSAFTPSDGVEGTSTLQIIINGTQAGTNYGQLLVTGGYGLNSGDPFFHDPTALALQWNYPPQLGDSFLIVTQAPPHPYSVDGNYFFAGLPPNSIDDSTNGVSVGISYNSNGVALTTLRTTNSTFALWKGSVVFTNYAPRNWSLTNNWAQNAAPAGGSVLMFSPYQTSAYPVGGAPFPVPQGVTNDLASGTSLAGLVFTGSNYMVYGNAITMTGGITNNTSGGTNDFHLDVAAAGELPLDIEPGGDFLMDGVIAGSGTVSKAGGGLLIYAGVTADAFVGTVAVSNGTLEVDGSFTDGSFTVDGGTLGGTGTVSAVTVNSGALKPGDSPGVLHVEGNLTMAPGAVFTAELDGPIPGSGYDQLQVSGGVSLNGTTLNLQPNFAAGVGAAFIILVNNGVGAISGTFAGLPEGAVFQAGGQYFSISYQAGSGNKNVVVTRVNPPAANFTGILSVPPTAVELFGAGGVNVTYTILANTNLATTNWVDIGTAAANGVGSFFFYDSNVVSYPQRFYKIQPP